MNLYKYQENSPSKYSDSDGAASALTESLDEDTDFELGNEPINLAARLQTKLSVPKMKKKPSRALLYRETEDFGLGIDNLDISKDAVNENVIFGSIEPPRRNKLRAAYSMNFQNDEQATIRLRPAKSMRELHPLQPSASMDICHRPLTVYTERVKPKKRESRMKMGHIKPQQQPAAPTQVNGMTFNPDSGMWEGNDEDLSMFDNAFDTIKGRKNMLLQQQDLLPSQSATMLFDSKNLCWVPREDAPDEDPFAGINDLSESVSAASTPNLRQSVMSTSSSRRDVSSPADAFVVPISTQRLWQENDLRFMRKFGRWIEEGDGLGEAANDLYKMVN